MRKWEGIYEFVSVVQHGSYTAAAEATGMSIAKLSKNISRLERHLGVRLLFRTTRRMNLTEDGERFYRRCSQGVEIFDRAEEDIALSQGAPRGDIKLHLDRKLPIDELSDVLADFSLQYPQLNLLIDTGDEDVDLLAGGYDAALCSSDTPKQSMVIKQLLSIDYCLVASPDYLARQDRPQSLEQLSEHNCLRDSLRVWRFLNGDDSVQISVSGNWCSDDSRALLAAARRGLGIAALPVPLVTDDMLRGDLLQVLPQWQLPSKRLSLCYPQQHYVPIKSRLLIDFLHKHLQHLNAEADMAEPA